MVKRLILSHLVEIVIIMRVIRRHICLFPGRLNLGGVGKNTLNLAEELVRQGHRVDLFLTVLAGEYKGLIPQGVNVYYGRGSAMRSFLSLVVYLRNESPEMLITARDYLNIVGFAACKVAFVRVLHVATLRTSVTADSQVRGGLRHRVIRSLARYSYPKMDSVVAVSQAVASDYLSIYRIPRLVTIYNPVITHRFDELLKASVSCEVEVSLDVPIILAVGRLSREKGFDVLIQAFAEVATVSDARLYILGEGPLRSELESMIAELGLAGKVVMPGYVPNPLSFMARSSVYVIPSRWEGLPTALVEALAAGVSVVATRCPGGSAEILEGGLHGALVDVDDSSALACAINSMLDEPTAGPESIKRGRSFSASNAVRHYLSLLEA